MTARPPLFILTCMRSYSSLVSTMLGQHPALYCLPEVNPFIASTLGGAVNLLQLVRKRTLDGLYRAVAEVEFGEQTDESVAQARNWVIERRHWTATDLMDHLGARLAPARLIEKSPSTVLQPGRIARAIALFPDAHFLHLTRHPVATTASIAAITNYGKGAGPAAKAQGRDPEALWHRINASIADAAGQIPSGRFMAIRGEDVLTDPDRYLAQICDWLGVSSTPADLEAMRHPERSPYAMIGPESAPFGNDPNFLERPVYAGRTIELPPLSSPLDWAGDGRHLRPETVALAHQLGYRASAMTFPIADTAA